MKALQVAGGCESPTLHVPARPGADEDLCVSCLGLASGEKPWESKDPVANVGIVTEPIASRPYMPGYGVLRPGEGSGLLPWSWVEERLLRSHDFWLATVTPVGAPHLMPVWAVWHERRLWFSSSNASRKSRNLVVEPRCTMSTENPLEPVVVQGRAQRVTDRRALSVILGAENAKYGTNYDMDLMDPASNSVFALLPESIFALDSTDFTGSPTRFTFRPDKA